MLAFLARPAPAAPPPAAKPPREADAREERVRMTRLRRTIAARLKEAQNTAAMLTTFNEVDMSAVMALRSEYRDAFEKKHGGARLGFMSFFVRACVVALKEFPAVNAEIDGDEIVYKHFVHMGIAVGGASGLVVPVIRDADRMSFAEIERAIADFGQRARDGALKLDDLAGGTFSITNGGVYGSLMSTPILNPPQSAILGMHKIQDRPMAIGGKIEIRPMMYLALSYDHRIVDGSEAVSFLVRVKERSRTRAGCCWDCDMSEPFDVIVIGAGPGGYVCAHARRPARPEGRLRGEARHPRRHLPQRRLHPVQGAAAIVGELRRADARLRRRTASPSARCSSIWRRMQARKGEVVSANVKGVEFLFRKNKITWLKGDRRASPRPARSTVAGTEYEAKHIVIATGSESVPLPGVAVDEQPHRHLHRRAGARPRCRATWW